MKRRKAEVVDESVQAVRTLLDEYEATHPGSKGSTYRFSPYSLRLRIIDPGFEGLDLVDRDNLVRKMLKRLPQDVLNDLTIILLLTERETRTSPANVDFEHPTHPVL